jgi:hypothetical protein
LAEANVPEATGFADAGEIVTRSVDSATMVVRQSGRVFHLANAAMVD